MAAQKCKFWAFEKFLTFLNVYYPKNPSNQSSKLSWFSRPNGRLSQNPKTGGFRVSFVPENDFKTCPTVNFPKNTQILQAWKQTDYIKFRHMPFYIWTQYNTKIVLGT